MQAEYIQACLRVYGGKNKATVDANIDTLLVKALRLSHVCSAVHYPPLQSACVILTVARAGNRHEVDDLDQGTQAPVSHGLLIGVARASSPMLPAPGTNISR